MYVAKINDRGIASYVYMFDDQLFDMDSILDKSYYMKKSSDQDVMVDFCNDWNHAHKDVIKKNNVLYYLNLFCKGVLQAPALVVLYACVVMGAMLLFGSEPFYEQIDLYGVSAFGSIRNTVIITYVISAIIGLMASLITYNNVMYKCVRCIISIITFVLISPVLFNTVFFATSNTILTLTVIMIVGCFFIRFILDRLIVNIIRKKTEQLIKDEHIKIGHVGEAEETAAAANTATEQIQPVIEKIRNNQRMKQYRKR